MNEIAIANHLDDGEIVLMEYMEPGQIGIIVSESRFKGNVVRRTCSTEAFCIEDLSTPDVDQCWTTLHTDLRVKLLPDAYIVVNLR